MVSTRGLILAGLTALGAAGAARAADLPPPPVMPAPPAEVVDTSGWYLRGDVGVGIASTPNFRSTFADGAGLPGSGASTAASVIGREQESLGDSAFVDVGVGYQYNPWLRFDVTGEYRTAQDFSGVLAYNIAGFTDYNGNQATARDLYSGKVQSTVALANAYVDLGTWWCLTPFIGAGVGGSYNRVYGLNDLGTGSTAAYPYANQGDNGFGTARASGKFDLAYAGYAGLDYAINSNLKLELAYRYLNMGEATSSAINCVGGGCARETQHYKLESNDIKLGMRWMFNDVATLTPATYVAPEAPIVRKY